VASEGPNEAQAAPPAETPPPTVDETLKNEIAALGTEDQKALQETLSSLMDDQRARIEYAESRRGSLATIGGVIVAAGLAALLQVAKDGWDYFPGRLGLLTLAVGLVVTGVVVLSVWAAQTNWNYPFKKVSTTWKHFYRDAIPGAGKPSVPWHSRLKRDVRTTKETQYTDIRGDFNTRTLSLVEPGISIAQDIEQSYLLHWTELYKNQFLTSLRQVLVRGIVISLAAAVVALGIGVVVAPDLYDDQVKDDGAKAKAKPTTRPTTTPKRTPVATPTPSLTKRGGAGGRSTPAPSVTPTP
jgi:ABC-type phosphate/phosphonate transport system permease subunit